MRAIVARYQESFLLHGQVRGARARTHGVRDY